MHHDRVVRPATFRVRRLLSWLPAAFFLSLFGLILLGAPTLHDRLFVGPLTLIPAVWLVRSVRLSVQTTDEAIIVRTSVWTHRFPWSDVVEAKLVRMPAASPFAARWPYVALGLHLRDGRVRRFSDISAASDRQSVISA